MPTRRIVGVRGLQGLLQLFCSYLGVICVFLWPIVCHCFIKVDEVCLSHWAVSGPVFNTSTLEAWGVIPWHTTWFVGLCIYCLDVSGSSLHRGKATLSPVSGVAGPSYVHWDRVVVPTTRCVRRVVQWVSSLIKGPVCIGVSTISLIVRSVIVSVIS